MFLLSYAHSFDQVVQALLPQLKTYVEECVFHGQEPLRNLGVDPEKKVLIQELDDME